MNFKTFFIAAAVVSSLLCPCLLKAHPHVFVYSGLRVIFDEKGLSGVRLRWVFDEMFGNMIISEFDLNGNRRFEPNEVAEIEKGAFSYLRNFDYFTHIKIDGQPFQVKFVKDFSADIIKNKLVYEFFVPCHVSAIDNYKEVKLAIYDETYYSSVFLVKKGIIYENQQPFDVAHQVATNRQAAYYYGQIYPEEITLRFKHKRD